MTKDVISHEAEALAKKIGGWVEYDETGRARVRKKTKLSEEVLEKIREGILARPKMFLTDTLSLVDVEIASHVLVEVNDLLMGDDYLRILFLSTFLPEVVKSAVAEDAHCTIDEVQIESHYIVAFPFEGEEANVTLWDLKL